MATEPMHEAVLRLDKAITLLHSTISELSRNLFGLTETMKLHIETLRIEVRKVEQVVDSKATQASVDSLGNDLRLELKAINGKLEKLLAYHLAGPVEVPPIVKAKGYP
ncbi:MAG: hypothetical protein U1E66_03460 [Rhodospirillales bacterium]